MADYRACQEAQRRAWGITEDGYVIPIATMVGANLHGGLMLGAFLPDGTAVAMSFAFLGRIDGRIGLYSQLTGVVPGYQSLGLGYRIKMHQREVCRGAGIRCIAWAFDPLQAGNAYFNLVRLGASAGRYIDNMYGERTDALNLGVPTDRLIAEWDVAEESPRRTEPNTTPPVPPPDTPCPWPCPGSTSLLIEIPADIARLRTERADRAERWRRDVRAAFQTAFAEGYRAVSVIRDDSATPRRVFYVLERSV